MRVSCDQRLPAFGRRQLGVALDGARAVAGRVAPWAERDFDCALVQLRLFHALGQGEAWATALRQTLDLAGQRLVPDGLRAAPPPVAGSGAAPIG